MTKRKRSIGELISSFVFFFGGLWRILEGNNLYSDGAVLKGILVFLGGAMSVAAAFRFQIQKIFDDKNDYKTDSLWKVYLLFHYARCI